MMKLKLCLMVVMIFGFVQSSRADDLSDPFKDWASLVDYMTSKGLDPINTNWPPIEEMCRSQDTGTDKHAYNKCKFQNAQNLALHTSDRAQCLIRVRGTYPDSLTTPRVDSLHEVDKNGAAHDFTRTMPAMSASELEAHRYSGVVECMQSLGWVNADNWALGKRNADCN